MRTWLEILIRRALDALLDSFSLSSRLTKLSSIMTDTSWQNGWCTGLSLHALGSLKTFWHCFWICAHFSKYETYRQYPDVSRYQSDLLAMASAPSESGICVHSLRLTHKRAHLTCILHIFTHICRLMNLISKAWYQRDIGISSTLHS